jgi:beta-phosphoglucomutase family hydrolase
MDPARSTLQPRFGVPNCLDMASSDRCSPYAFGVKFEDCEAVLFDLDGVLTPTADVHMRAWQSMLSDFLLRRGIAEPYVSSDYFHYIDGKPRYEGVRSFLHSRGISLPDGDPSDPPTAETVCGLGNRKNEVFAAVLADEGVIPYPGTAELLDQLAERGTKTAVVSSSRNAPSVLEAAGLQERFLVVVDGAVAGDLGLAGKPSAETFVHAATELGADVARSAVIEDALSGVAAGKAGGFGLVVGIDRGVGSDRLTQAGADLVVTDLAALIAP